MLRARTLPGRRAAPGLRGIARARWRVTSRRLWGSIDNNCDELFACMRSTFKDLARRVPEPQRDRNGVGFVFRYKKRVPPGRSSGPHFSRTSPDCVGNGSLTVPAHLPNRLPVSFFGFRPARNTRSLLPDARNPSFRPLRPFATVPANRLCISGPLRPPRPRRSPWPQAHCPFKRPLRVGLPRLGCPRPPATPPSW